MLIRPGVDCEPPMSPAIPATALPERNHPRRVGPGDDDDDETPIGDPDDDEDYGDDDDDDEDDDADTMWALRVASP
jgi:hypothetical protein